MCREMLTSFFFFFQDKKQRYIRRNLFAQTPWDADVMPGAIAAILQLQSNKHEDEKSNDEVVSRKKG